MNFKTKLSLYKLELINYSSIPSIVILAIEEGHESESLFICAGMTEGDNSFELELYFKRTLNELNIDLPNFEDAFYIVTLYYFKGILSGEIDFLKGMHFIDEKLLDKEFEIFGESKKYAHDSSGFHNIYSGYIGYRDMDYYINRNELIEGKDPKEIKNVYKSQILEDIKMFINSK